MSKNKVLKPSYDKDGQINGFWVPLQELLELAHDKLLVDFMISELRKEK